MTRHNLHFYQGDIEWLQQWAAKQRRPGTASEIIRNLVRTFIEQQEQEQDYYD